MAVATGTLVMAGVSLYSASKQRKAAAKSARNSLEFQKAQNEAMEEQKQK